MTKELAEKSSLIAKEEERILNELTDEDLTFPMYLTWKGGTIEVVGRIKCIFDDFLTSDITAKEIPEVGFGEYVEGKGYVKDGIVYQYHKEKPKRVTSPVPYFYIIRTEKKDGTKQEQLVTKYPLSREETIRTFGIKRLVDISFSRIVNETNGDEVLYDAAMIDDMTAARSKYVPDINKDDDCLKKMVKYMILNKDVDINKYKSVMDTSYALTNMKSALISKTKMSITYFLMWVELLGVDFSISVTDNGRDTQDPLKTSLLYRSRDNGFYHYDPKKFMVALTAKVENAKQKALEDKELCRLIEADDPKTEDDSEEETD